MLLARAVLDRTQVGDRIFEGGVSTGYFARLLVDAGRIVDGAELDPVAAAEAARVCDRIVVGDLETVDLDGLARRYDALVFGDTLEHLKDPVELLRRLGPRLKEGGYLVTSIPNVANWSMRIGLLFGRFRYTDRGILDRTHLRFYTLRTASEMLAEAGYQMVESTAAVPVPLVASRRLSHIAHWLGNLRPSVFAYTFIITAQKAEAKPHPQVTPVRNPWWRR